MKSRSGWPSGSGSGTNTTGFNALPVGTWLGAEVLAPIGSQTKFWTSNEEPKDPKFAWDRALVSDSTNFSNYGTLKVTLDRRPLREGPLSAVGWHHRRPRRFDQNRSVGG
jgi:uncharacterized protein (TIGR02145 family)